MTTKYPALQRALLGHAATLVAPGGALVYSTCTTEPEETGEVIDAFLHEHPAFSLGPLDAMISNDILSNDRKYMRTWPHKHNMDGFFAVRMNKS